MRVGPLDKPAINMEEACRLAREAGDARAHLLLLPEGCLTGNAQTDPARQTVMDMDAAPFAPLSAIARGKGVTICAGFTTRFGDNFNVVHAIVQPDGAVHFQRKGYRSRTEPPFIKAWPDPSRTPFTVDGKTVVITICSEFGVPAVMRETARHKPDLILHPSAGSMNPDEVWMTDTAHTPPVRDFINNCRKTVEGAATRNAELGIPRIAANPVGFDGETWWPGNGYAVSGKGDILLWVEGENRPDRQTSRLGYVIL